MADILTVAHLGERARYWLKRAEEETNPRGQAQFLETAAILAREANLLREEMHQQSKFEKRSCPSLAPIDGAHSPYMGAIV